MSACRRPSINFRRSSAYREEKACRLVKPCVCWREPKSTARPSLSRPRGGPVVQAGPWLAAALEACRSPDGLAKVSPGGRAQFQPKMTQPPEFRLR